MPYIGHGVTNAGTFYVIDDLTMSSSTTYTLQVGGVSVTPKADNLLITLDGVIQHTPDAYTISGSTITFASAPGSGVDFYGIIMGQSASLGQGSVGADELKVTGDGSANQILSSDADGTMTWKDGTLSTTSATGDIIYRNNSGVLAKLAIGSAGQLLTVASGLPSWATDSEPYLPLAGGTMSGAINLGSQNVTNGGTITGTFVGGLTGNVTGNASGTALTVTQAAQTSITRVGSSLGIGLAPTHNFNLLGTGTVEARFYSSDGDCQLQIASDTDQTHDSILNFLSGSSGRGQIIYDHHDTAASQKMVFKTGDAAVTAMTILGDGNVGIGTASPTYLLDTQFSGNDKGIRIKKTNANSGNARILIDGYRDSGAGDLGAIYFGNNGTTVGEIVVHRDSADAAGKMNFGTANYSSGNMVTTMTIDSDNQVGIGTSSPLSLFHLEASSDPTFRMTNVGTCTTYIKNEDTGPFLEIMVDTGGIQLGTGNPAAFAPKLTMLNNGKVGIGHSPTGNFQLEVYGSSGDVGCTLWSDTVNNPPTLAFRARDGSDPKDNGDTLGQLYWNGWDGSDWSQEAAMIAVVATGDHSSDNCPTQMIFNVNTGQRLDSLAMNIKDDLEIDGNFNDTSDIILKEDIKDMSNMVDVVNNFKPSTFKWKESTGRIAGKRYGFIAQEIEEVVPELVSGEEGSKTLSTIGIVAVLAKAVQELSTANNELKARIEALENA